MQKVAPPVLSTVAQIIFFYFVLHTVREQLAEYILFKKP